MTGAKRTALGQPTIILVALLFLAPVLLAMWLRFGAGDWEAMTGNYGDLVEPPVGLQGIDVIASHAGYWLILQLTAAHCDVDCVQLSQDLQRVQVALGANSRRVHRVSVKLESPLGHLLEDKLAALKRGAVLLVDPRSFLMMRYKQGFDVNGLLDDLERLLRYSKVGVQ